MSRRRLPVANWSKPVDEEIDHVMPLRVQLKVDVKSGDNWAAVE